MSSIEYIESKKEKILDVTIKKEEQEKLTGIIEKIVDEIGIDNLRDCEYEYEEYTDESGISMIRVIIKKSTVNLNKKRKMQPITETNTQEADNVSEEDVEMLKKQADELRKLRELLESVQNMTVLPEKGIKIVKNSIDSLKESFNSETKMTPILRNKLDRITNKIDFISKILEDNNREYNDIYEKNERILVKEKRKLSRKENISEKDYEKKKEKYEKIKSYNESKLDEINQKIISLRVKLTELTSEKNRIEYILKQVEKLDLTIGEYREIEDVLENKAIMDLIYAKKGLNKEEILKEIAELRKKQNDLSVVQSIQVLYSIDINYTKDGEVRVIDMQKNDVERLKAETLKLPQKIVGKTKKVDYVPETAPADVPFEETKSTEVIKFYRDKNSDDLYVKSYVKNRFNLITDTKVLINGVLSYKIDIEDAESIIANKDNNYSPYKIEYVDVDIIFDDNSKSEEKTEADIPNNDESYEKIVIYSDNSNHKYVRQSAIKKFGIEPLSEIIDINGTDFYHISDDDSQRILIGQTSDTSYVVDYRKIINPNFKVKENLLDEKVITEVVEEIKRLREEKNTSAADMPNEKIVEEEIEVRDETPKEENIEEDETPDNINSVDADATAIIEALTSDIVDEKSGASSDEPVNLNSSNKFKEELNSGDVLYNIIHVLPTTGKATANFLAMLTQNITSSKKAKEILKKIEDRMDNLTEEEYKILFEKCGYNDRKSEPRNKFDLLIKQKSLKWALDSLERINDTIKEYYNLLFQLVDKINEVNDIIDSEEIEKEQEQELSNKCNILYKRAYDYVLKIINYRKKAKSILYSESSELEEIYNNIQNDYPYLGLISSKDNNFNEELQKELIAYGQALENAINEKNKIAAVEYFVDMEVAHMNYYDESESSKSKNL